MSKCCNTAHTLHAVNTNRSQAKMVWIDASTSNAFSPFSMLSPSFLKAVKTTDVLYDGISFLQQPSQPISHPVDFIPPYLFISRIQLK